MKKYISVLYVSVTVKILRKHLNFFFKQMVFKYLEQDFYDKNAYLLKMLISQTHYPKFWLWMSQVDFRNPYLYSKSQKMLIQKDPLWHFEESLRISKTIPLHIWPQRHSDTDAAPWNSKWF